MLFKIINSSEWEEENVSINFYEFSNFNQNPQLKIHIFTPKLFNYLTELSLNDQYQCTRMSEEEYRILKNKIG